MMRSAASRALRVDKVDGVSRVSAVAVAHELAGWTWSLAVMGS
jgi:hypothetical protein